MVRCCCCVQRHYVTNTSASPSHRRDVHRNVSAPASPVHPEMPVSRMFGSQHDTGGDTLHRQQPSLPHAETIRPHTSMSDNVGVRYPGYGDRSRVDREYSDYAYVRASALNHPQIKDAALDYRGVGSRGVGVVSDGAYTHPYWSDHHAQRSREVVVGVNSHRPKDPNLYHIASNRTMSYSSTDELPSAVPVTASATASRFLDPTPHWPTNYGSLEGAYRRHNGGDSGNVNLSSGSLYAGTPSYAGSEVSLPDRTYDAMPRRLASPPVRYETPPHVRAAAADVSCDSVELSPADSPAVVLHGQNYVEVSKPFEMADVYKYSSRMRRVAADGSGDRTADLRSSSSPHLSNHMREPPPHRDQRPTYVAPSTQYFPSRHYRKPVFD